MHLVCNTLHLHVQYMSLYKMKKYRSKELDNLDRPGPFETFETFCAKLSQILDKAYLKIYSKTTDCKS